MGTLALVGLPPLSGFVSKEEILAVALASHSQPLFVTAVATVFLTSYYMSRLFVVVFLRPDSRQPLHEAGPPAGEAGWAA